MVKHWKRTHQRGPHSPELDDMISDGGSDSAPPTPESHSAMPWQSHHSAMMGHPSHQLQRAASFADFGQHMNNYSLQQQYNNHRHSLSSSGPEYHGAPPLSQPSLHPHGHPQQQQQHPSVQILQRTGSMPHHNYFVPDQNNPGVATMTTNQHPVQQYHPQVPRQAMERLPLEIPAYTNADGLASSIPNSSPGSFSAASGRSPSAQDGGFYTHVAPGQSAAYTLHHAASPVTQQTPQMMTFPQAQAVAVAAPQPSPAEYQQQQQQAQQVPVPQQQPQQQSAQQWYETAQYQSPVEVTTIGSLPPFGTVGMYDPWGTKLEYEDAGMQLPSARIESM